MGEAARVGVLDASQAAAWLAEHAPAYEEPPGRLTPFAAVAEEEQREQVERARAWERRKAEHGWAGLHVPVELGGQGGTMYQHLLFVEAESAYRLPFEVVSVTQAMVLPTLLAWGSPEQRRRYVPPSLDGTALWCQLFSEPGAGSDLAAIATRARPVVDGWVVTGQKIWTSHAHHADFGYLLARTNPDAPKHGGLSAFVLDMHAPGVEVRPIRQATGSSTFAEVFFDDVVLPRDAIVGSPGDGWKVAITTLMNERLSLGPNVVPWPELLDLAIQTETIGEPLVRQRLADIYGQLKAVAAIRQEVLSAVRAGREPGPEGSMVKLVCARLVSEVGDLALTMLGEAGCVPGPWTQYAIGSLGMLIGGGTEEVLKNIIADRVLGLPREPGIGQRGPGSGQPGGLA